MEENTQSEAQKTTKKTTKKTSSKTIAAIIIIAVLAIVIVLIIIFTSGSTTTTTTTTKNEETTTSSVTCSSATVEYSKLTISGTDPLSHDLRVNLIFRSDVIDTIGLNYTIYYADSAAVSRAEAILHAEFNTNLAEAGFKDSSALNNKFNQFSDRLILNLFAESDEINVTSAPFFMISTDKSQITAKTQEDYIKNYQKLGFSCQEN